MYRAPSAPTGAGPRRYRVANIESNIAVHYALDSRLRQDPEYVKAVFRSYIDAKFSHGRNKQEVGWKLETLEQELPSFASSFHAVRAEYGLPPSRALPRPQSAFTSTTSPYGSLGRRQTDAAAAGRPASTSLNGSRRPSSQSQRTTQPLPAEFTVRPTTEEGDEPPPPPYARQDPEPEQTRILQERLAAEAEAAGTLTPSAAQPDLASPARSTHSLSQPARRPPSPAAEPDDPDVARVWEESQYDEAKRMSLAAERERQELEEAMRLSLAEAEAMGVASSVAGPSSRPGGMPGGPTGSSAFTVEDVSHRRTASEGTGHRPDLAGDMAGLRIPGDWESSVEDLGGSHLPAPMQPQRTGAAVLQSKNPFLSPQEREEAVSVEGANPIHALASGPTSRTDTASTMRQPSSSSLRDAPGSSRTMYAPPLGPPPGSKPLPTVPTATEPTYAPPAGLPPAHLRSPSATEPPRLPPRVSPSAFPWDNEGGIGLPLSSPMQAPGPARTIEQLSTPTASTKLKTPLQFPAGEDPLGMLHDFDTVFLVDDSTSMAGERWNQARAALMEVAEIAARYDDDGVDIYFLNSKRVGKELKAAPDVEDLFRGLEPKGATPTGLRLEAILREYMGRLERSVLSSPALEEQEREVVKPMNLIVVTDGAFALPVTQRLRLLSSDSSLDRANLVSTAPTDDPESVLIACAKRLDKGDFPLSQIGVQFLQIGNDAEAREALQELDDGLAQAHGVRDMVDTVPSMGQDLTAGLIIKTLLGGINRRLDRRSG